MGLHLVYIILTTLILSLFFCFRKKQNSTVKFIPLFLLFQLLVEYYIYRVWMNFEPTSDIYNYYTNISICIYLFFISNMVVSKLIKRIIYAAILFTFSTLVFIIFDQDIIFNIYNYMIGALLVIIFCIYYMLEVFKLGSSPNLLTESSFWLATAFLFVHLCGFMLFSLNNYFLDASQDTITSLKYLLSALNYLYYMLISMSFLCKYIFKTY